MAGDCAGALEASARLSAATKRDADMSGVLDIVLGICLVESGQHAAAVGHLRAVVDRPLLSRGLASMYAPAWYELGRAYEGSGRAADALDCYEHVLAMWKHADADIPLKRETRAARDRLLQQPSM
jgi:tetratricopeptide (TPR) repeat protein